MSLNPSPQQAAVFVPGSLGCFLSLVLGWALLLGVLLPAPAGAAFGLTTTSDAYTIDTDAGLVFKVRRTDNGSSTQSPGDLMSLVYNGVEYQNQSRGSHINSGFDFVYNGVSAVSVNAAVVNTDYIKVTVQAGELTHYYLARRGYPHIYMATYFTAEPNAVGGLCRYIVRIPAARLPNGPPPSDIRNNTGAIEASDIFGMADGTTRSKHYSNMRLKDWSYIGATNNNPSVGVWMVRSNHEGDSGGPFYRSLLNQCGDDQEITYIINYGEAQTEPFRTSILNGPYALVFTDGAPPPALDTGFVADMDLTGFVGPAGRGNVACAGITGRDTRYPYTIGFANSTAQYWTDADPANGAFMMRSMLPGTYTMRVYKNELTVFTDSNVTVTAGGTTTLNPITITDDPSRVVPRWRIGNWDGTPNEFLNGDKVTWMHPSDVRMSNWNPGPYVVGASSPATGIPAYQWKDVNANQVIRFNLTADQLVASTVRVGITVAFANARPNISMNSWTSPLQGPSHQPDTRTLTVGTYRGNNATFTFNVPASALVAGTNTLTVYPISGTTTTGFLSPGYSLDCIELTQGTQTLSTPGAPATLSATTGNGSIDLSWSPVTGASSYVVQRSRYLAGPYENVAELSATSFSDSGAGRGRTFYYLVRALNSAGVGPASPQASAALPGSRVYLRFDESSGATAADSSGNRDDGVLSGGPTFAAGKIGNALNFNGSSQFVSLPAGGTSDLNHFTISTWLRVTSFNTWARVFDFGTGTDNYMFLATQYSAPAGNAAKMRFAIRTPNEAEQIINSSTAIAPNTWVHVAITLNGTTGRMYLNGAQVGMNTSMTFTPSSLGITTRNYLGKSQWDDPYLNGSLDDFRIYNRALSAGEITALATAVAEAPPYLTATPEDGKVTLTWGAADGATSYSVKRATTSGGPYQTLASGLMGTSFTDTAVVNGTTYHYVVAGSNAQGEGPRSIEVAVTPSDLRVHLRFDELSGTTAADSSGRGFDATTVNGPAWGAGKLGNAVTLSGASSQYVNLPSGIVDGLTSVTITCWVRLSNLATYSRIFDFGSDATPTANAGAYMFLTPTNGSAARFAITTAGYANEQHIPGTSPVPTGVWTHVAVTISGSTGRLYVNGTQVGINTGMTLTPSSLGAVTRSFIGKSLFTGDPYLSGSIDDFRIYGRALSGSELGVVATPPPATPGGLSATAGNGHVALTWTAVSGATSYRVQRSLSSGSGYSEIATSAATGYTDSAVTNGTTYYYVVSAINTSGTSANSGPVSARPTAPITAEETQAPEISLSEGSTRITVKASVAGHSYQLQYCEDLAGGVWKNHGSPQPGNGSALEFTIPTDASVPNRFYRVQIHP